MLVSIDECYDYDPIGDSNAVTIRTCNLLTVTCIYFFLSLSCSLARSLSPSLTFFSSGLAKCVMDGPVYWLFFLLLWLNISCPKAMFWVLLSSIITSSFFYPSPPSLSPSLSLSFSFSFSVPLALFSLTSYLALNFLFFFIFFYLYVCFSVFIYSKVTTFHTVISLFVMTWNSVNNMYNSSYIISTSI